MKVGCWEEGNGIIVKEDGTARAEQFNVCACAFVATLHFLTY